MKRLVPVFSLLFTIFLFFTSKAQVKEYTVANAHSHNDYEKKQPFYLAFQNGFGSIEADIFAVDGKLCVAHSKKEINPNATLVSLYIKPLLQEFKSGKTRKLNLLVDIKDDYKITLPLLVKELEPLKKYLSTTAKAKYITISISGNRPLPAEYKNYPDFIFFDDDLKHAHNKEEWNRVSLVSLPFDKISAWKGEGEISNDDIQKLKHVIDSTHTAGKPIRFWAAPDTEEAWQWQMKLGVDLIGTDAIEGLAAFLHKSKSHTAAKQQ